MDCLRCRIQPFKQPAARNDPACGGNVVPEEVEEHYLGADPDLVRQCRILRLALVTMWCWRDDDQLPNGQHWRTEGLNRVRAALDRYEMDWA